MDNNQIPPTSSSTQPINPPAPTNPTSPTKPRYNMIRILVIAAIVLTLLISGFFGLNYYIRSQELKPNNQELTAKVQQPTPDPISGWKTYTNAQYGFLFKYPSEWAEDTTFITNSTDYIGLVTSDLDPHGGGRKRGIYISVYKNVQNLSIDDYINKVDIPAQQGCGDVHIVKEKKQILEPVDSEMTIGYCGAGTPGPQVQISRAQDIIILSSDGVDDNQVYQIFSTIKFTDQKSSGSKASTPTTLQSIPTVDTSGWKTYTNPDMGISFEYPNKYLSDLDDDSQKDLGKRSPVSYIFPCPSLNLKECARPQGEFQISSFDADGKTLNDWISTDSQSSFNPTRTKPCFMNDLRSTITQTTIDGNDAITYKYFYDQQTSKNFCNGQDMGSDKEWQQNFVKKGAKIYQIVQATSPDNFTEMEQILLTFKFTQ